MTSSIRPIDLGTRTKGDALCVFLCILSLGYLIAGRLLPAQRNRLEVLPIAASFGEAPGLGGTGFANDAVYPTTSKAVVRGAVQFYGSWIGSDQSVGSVHSPWYESKPGAYLLIAGYPTRPGISLSVQIVNGPSHIATRPLRILDPGLHWQLQRLSLDKLDPGAKFRIVAVDNSKELAGWIGFSTPFVIEQHRTYQLFSQLFLVLLAASAAVVVFISPGLILRDFLRRRSGKFIPFIWIALPGFLASCLLGLLSWTGPRWAGSRLVSQAGLTILFLYALYRLVKTPLSSCTTHLERKAFLALLVFLSIAVAKSTYSVGPVGELYADTISRTLDVGDRSDSRISYHVVQLVAVRARPNSPVARMLLSPWNFSHRGPLAALAASPIVLAGPVVVPPSMPDQSWTVFDGEGFMAYRLSMIVMASSSLLVIFGLSQRFLSQEWSLLAFLITITAPFVLHETYFTWPKLEAASFVLLAAYCLLESTRPKLRCFAAGSLLGIGYLCHPSALLSLPGLLALIVLTGRERIDLTTVRRWAVCALNVCLGLAVWLLLWRLINRHHFDQSGFTSYLFQADQQVPNAANWLKVRLDSLLNTLLPLNLFLFHRSHPAVNSIFGRSNPVIEFFFQDWTGLPFGAGVVFFLFLIRVTWRAYANARAVLILVYLLPLALFTIYWGAASTGMLREGLHAWFLAIMVGSVIVLERTADSGKSLLRLLRVAVLFRGVEMLLLLLLPAIWSRQRWFNEEFLLSDIVSLLIMFSGTVWLTLVTSNSIKNLSSLDRAA